MEDILTRLQWLAFNDVEAVHLCGGEPTVRRDLVDILDASYKIGLRNRMTTNGLTIRDDIVDALARTDAGVKVSLHGPASVQNAMLNVAGYQQTLYSIDRLISSGVSVSIQTILTREYPNTVDFVVDFCLKRRIRKVSFVPFIPRGRGQESQGRFSLSAYHHDLLKARVRKLKNDLAGRLDIRWLDFHNRPYYVVETDGRLVVQAASEAEDVELCRIPSPAAPLGVA